MQLFKNYWTHPSCKVHAFFNQKFAILSGPGALQFFFFVITFLVVVDSNVNPSCLGSGTLSLVASLTSPSHGAEGSPLPFFIFPQQLPELTRFLDRLEHSFFVLTFLKHFLVLVPWPLFDPLEIKRQKQKRNAKLKFSKITF